VAIWFGINRFFPHIAFDSTFSTLQVLLLTEGCCIGSVFLMTQHRQAALDRRITVSDYVVDCRIQQEIKELRPLIQALHKDMEDKKNNFLCNGCGEPGYKCCCDERVQPHQS
jgi:uncharacterized membrane protein